MSIKPSLIMRYNFPKITCLSMVLMGLFASPLFAQQKAFFKTEVDTELKPWTDLEFYNDPENFQFAIVTDNTGGMRPGVFEIGIEKLNLMMPEFVLSVGDLIQGYTQDTMQIRREWEDFETKIDKLNVPFFYLPGNHDITNLVMQKEWEKRYGKRYYSFKYKEVLFIILDSNDDDDHSLTEAQTSFAIETLEKNPDVRWTFVLMHHPIWKYDTEGRFEKVEKVLSQRKHTVLAGHEHKYQYIERNNANYYVLATTGGGSQLRGNLFGEFDHFVWVTMSDEGPIMANLRLDGILAHDISNEKTAAMARSMLSNTHFKFLFLANEGNMFEHGTGYIKFNNTSDVPLNVELTFQHHHEVDMNPSIQSLKINPGEEKILEISVKAQEPTRYENLGFLKFYWKLSYDTEAFKDFFLDGNMDFPIERSPADYFSPQTTKFITSTEVNFDQPLALLNTEITISNEKADPSLKTFVLDQTTTLEARLRNDKNEFTEKSLKKYEKTPLKKGVKVKKPVIGLNYARYNGYWNDIPDFETLSSDKEGVAKDFTVSDLASGDKNNFGLRYTGFIEIPEDGLYHFRSQADDMAQFKIHDEIICIDGTSGTNTDGFNKIGNTGAVALKKGFHPISIDFVEQQGNERLRFYYKLKENDDWIYIDLANYFRISGSKN